MALVPAKHKIETKSEVPKRNMIESSPIKHATPLLLRTCYHPLFLFNQFGDLERCALRPGNVHSADDWEGVLKPVVTRYQSKVSRLYFRADAGFANPEVYEYLEAEGIKYAMRLPANRVLQERIGYLLKRPVGPPVQ